QAALENPLIQLDEPDISSNTLLDAQEYSEGSYWEQVKKRSRNFDDALDSYLENVEAHPITLHQHIANQLPLLFTNDQQRLIAYKLLEFLDPTGYFLADLSEVSHLLTTSPALVEAVLHSLQTLDPAGIFARNLKECLLLQLREFENLPPQTTAVINDLELLADNKIDKLLKVCSITREELIQITKHIKGLNPKPGLAFENPFNFSIIPDVLLEFDEGNRKWHLRLNDRSMPKVAFDPTYVNRLNLPTVGKDEKKYLKDHYQHATGLIKALEQRTKTILKVASIVFEHQRDFFEKGIQYLKPLTLKTVAEAIDMHESSISRVTQNKYMMTPRGLFEFRYFFSSSIQHEPTGEELSSTSIRHKIKQLIQEESPECPLSDDILVAMLAKEGVLVARRTVAKYREEMKIPSSYERKRLKRAVLS
ncbi:MAG: RNA polymerase factor sigma-54, partial [Alphaproteobacteria bacterium]|nr:RNA polymerase factor sigma-54 [Alphaproteobacteria bacterium]